MDTTLLIKTKKTLKEDAQKVSVELGVSLSTIMNAFLKQLVRDKEITFSTREYRMTPYLEKVIKASRAEYKSGKTAGPFSSVEDMMDSLNS